jgi:hypothetical protein
MTMDIYFLILKMGSGPGLLENQRTSMVESS